MWRVGDVLAVKKKNGKGFPPPAGLRGRARAACVGVKKIGQIIKRNRPAK